MSAEPIAPGQAFQAELDLSFALAADGVRLPQGEVASGAAGGRLHDQEDSLVGLADWRLRPIVSWENVDLFGGGFSLTRQIRYVGKTWRKPQ